MKNLIFLGMIGSNMKSVAAKAAESLNHKFVDTDEVLTRNTGMSLHDLYTLLSVDTFKDLTYRLAAQLSSGENYVIAVGDSILKNSDAITVLKESAYTVYIEQSTDSIVENCTDIHHPLLARGLNRIYELYNERSELFYKYADISMPYADNAYEQALLAYNAHQNPSTVYSPSNPALKAFFKYYIENINSKADSERFSDECEAAVSAILKKYLSEVNDVEH